MDWITEPWPWYIAGPMISLVMFALLFAGKSFGMSSSFRSICAMGGAGKVADFFNFDWKKQRWNLVVVAGAIIGGFLASRLMTNKHMDIDPQIAAQLHEDYNISSAGKAYLPPELFSAKQLGNPFVLFILILGGFLVGFGARYAGGCTSGHAIAGLSNLQWPSLIGVIGFFIGGLAMVHFVYPVLFG